MIERLEQLEREIERTCQEDVTVQRECLEPLFQKIYEEIANHSVEDFSLLLKLSQLENRLTKRILPVVPKVSIPLDREEKEVTLKTIVYYTRKKAMDLYHCNIEEDSLRSRSKDLSMLLLEIAKGLEVPSCMIDIGSIFHFPYEHYVVLSYVDGFYLFDITYQEFFLLGYNFPTRFYPFSPSPRTCEIGGRMLQGREESASHMIEEGYLKVDSLDFQNYCDGCSEFGEIAKEQSCIGYLQKLLEPLKGSSDKIDRILLSKMHDM